MTWLVRRLWEAVETLWFEVTWWARRRLRRLSGRRGAPRNTIEMEVRLVGAHETVSHLRRMTDEVEELGLAWGRLPEPLRRKVNAEIDAGLWQLAEGSWECGAQSSDGRSETEPESE